MKHTIHKSLFILPDEHVVSAQDGHDVLHRRLPHVASLRPTNRRVRRRHRQTVQSLLPGTVATRDWLIDNWLFNSWSLQHLPNPSNLAALIQSYVAWVCYFLKIYFSNSLKSQCSLQCFVWLTGEIVWEYKRFPGSFDKIVGASLFFFYQAQLLRMWRGRGMRMLGRGYSLRKGWSIKVEKGQHLIQSHADHLLPRRVGWPQAEGACAPDCWYGNCFCSQLSIDNHYWVTVFNKISPQSINWVYSITVGAGSAFVNDTVEVNARLDPSKADWIKVRGGWRIRELGDLCFKDFTNLLLWNKKQCFL